MTASRANSPLADPLRLPPAEHAQPAARAEPMVLDVRVVAGSGGGPDKTILRTARHLAPHRFRMAAAYIHPHDDPGFDAIRRQAGQFGCPLHEVAEAGPLDPRTVRRLYQLCRKLRVDVWHGHDYKSNALGLLLHRPWPMKLVTTVHGWTWDTPRTRLYHHLDNWCLPRYEQVIAVSPKLREHCLRLGIPPQRVTCLPNGIDMHEYRPTGQRAGLRDQFGIAPHALAIAVVSRLSVEKGVDRALRLLAAVRSSFPAAQVHVVGDGPERCRLEALARELQIENAVRFWGWQADPRRFYEAADLLLLPSHTEGSPNVVLEAMAMGLCVTATNVGGVEEVLEAGRCGVVLEQAEDTWAARLAPLLANAGWRAELARRGRRRVEEHYTFEQRVAQVAGIYRQVLGLPAITQEPQPMRQAA